MLSNDGFQDYTHQANIWFPGLSSQYKNERIAREMRANHSLNDYYARNANI